MKKFLIDMPALRQTEDGSCFIKALEVLYRFYKYNLQTYTLLGIGEILDTQYTSIDFENNMSCDMFVNKSRTISELLNKKLAVKFFRNNFSDSREAYTYIEQKIFENTPVCVGLNTYDLPYCPDYHVKEGGFFNTYHMAIVRGVDKENKKIHLFDPTFQVELAEMDISEFIVAWSDNKGMRGYEPFLYYEFYNIGEGKKQTGKGIIRESCLDNINMYFDENEVEIKERKCFRGRKGLLQMCSDLESLSEREGGFVEQCVDNIQKGIFHGVRWSRKSFSLFLKHDVSENEKLISYPDEIDELFNKWSETAIRITMILKSKRYVNLKMLAGNIRRIINQETIIFEKILKDLIRKGE